MAHFSEPRNLDRSFLQLHSATLHRTNDSSRLLHASEGGAVPHDTFIAHGLGFDDVEDTQSPTSSPNGLLAHGIPNSQQTPQQHPETRTPTASDGTELLQNAAGYYRPRRQKLRSWTIAFVQWLTTLILCVFYVLILSAYQKKPSIASDQRRAFNALTTGISFLLGVNLTTSLKTYAQLMRWRLLALRYRPLRQFELIASCDEFRNVAKLLLQSMRREFPFISTGGVFCIIWLALNISLLFIVACIGLTYGLDDPALYNGQARGNVTFLNLAALQTGNYDSDIGAINSNMNTVNTWGTRGLNVRTASGIGHHLAAPYQIETYGNGTSSYYLQSFSPKGFGISSFSGRRLESDTTCVEHEVQSVFIDTYNDWRNFTSLDSKNNSNPVDVDFWWGHYPGYGGLAVWSKMKSECGFGCTYVDVFVARSTNTSNYSTENRYYRCQNIVSPIQDQRDGWSVAAAPVYQINSPVAELLAGALGWSDDVIQDSKPHWVSHGYTNATAEAQTFHARFGSKTPTKIDMADFVSTFTTKAVAAMDDVNTGLRNFTSDAQGVVPIQSQRLAVDWRSTAGLLGGIVVGQLLVMVVVVTIASQAFIRDDSPLSMARLFFSLIRDRSLGDKGCMLKREELIREMDNPEVIYGWVKTEAHHERGAQPLGRVDVFTRPDDPYRVERVKTEFDNQFTYM